MATGIEWEKLLREMGSIIDAVDKAFNAPKAEPEAKNGECMVTREYHLRAMREHAARHAALAEDRDALAAIKPEARVETGSNMVFYLKGIEMRNGMHMVTAFCPQSGFERHMTLFLWMSWEIQKT